MQYLLGHDVGTSGDKAVLITTNGQVVASDVEPYPTHYPKPLHAEQDPEEMWRAVGATTRRLLDQTGIQSKEILAVSFSSQMVNAILLDKQVQPLCPAISWLDGRAVEEADMVMRKLGGPKIFALLVGVAITGKDLLPKYLWLKRNEPDVYEKAATIVDVSGYILYRATGRLVYERSTASVTGFLNLKNKTWDTTLMRFFGVDKMKFPELISSHERVGGLTKEASSTTGLLECTPVIAGAGDAMAVAVGSGAVLEGEGHLCLGTSGFVGIVTSKRKTGRQGIATIQSADLGKLLLIGETETCGECLKWAARELYQMEPGPTAYAHMDKIVAETEPGSGGLIFSPWMYGERSPVADECVRASFINLGANHSRAQMTRTIYEGVAYNLNWILETIEKRFGFRPDPIRVIGGGAKGLPWLRIISDISGRTLETVPYPRETAAVGAALLGAVGMGVYPSIEALKQVVPTGEIVKPNPDPPKVYTELYEAFKSIYPSLCKIYHRLNEPETETAH
jgi:xylulokinase